MMKKITFLITFFLSVSTFAKTPLESKNPPAKVTLDYFLEACTVVGETQFGMIPNFDCESYIYGVLDAHAATQSNLKKPQVCIPKNIAPWQVYEIVSAAPIKPSEHQTAAPTIIKALSEKYPCR